MNRLMIWGLSLLGASLVWSSAAAHIILTSHQARHDQRSIKQGPCGLTGGTRSQNVYTYTAGETIVLVWDEFIPHPGHFRIAFDADGDDDFVDPADYDDFFTNEAVLFDELFPHDRGGARADWSQEVTLPDVVCDNCTLQLVQMMTDKPPYVVGTNDLYYNCIDLVLVAAPTPDGGPVEEDVGGVAPPADAGMDPGVDMAPPSVDAAAGDMGLEDRPRGGLEVVEDDGCSTVTGATPGAALLVLLLGLWRPRRRRASGR
jgi:uncharacterized protein (TIGR03382 family)